MAGKKKGIQIRVAGLAGRMLRPVARLSRRNRIIIILILVLALVYRYRGIFIAATVNGKAITRYAVVQELEKMQGSTVLDSLITEELIKQEAKSMGLDVSPGEIEDEIAKIEESVVEQGQTLDSVLALQGMDRFELEEQISLQKLVEKLVADKIAINDEEVENYKTENADFLPEDITDEEIETQISQQKTATAFQEWIAGVKEEANIDYLIDY